jgi:hypothetical protein
MSDPTGLDPADAGRAALDNTGGWLAYVPYLGTGLGLLATYSALRHCDFAKASEYLGAAVIALTVGMVVGPFGGAAIKDVAKAEEKAAAEGEATAALKAAADRAVAKMGEGRGAVYGTYVHAAFRDEVRQLGRADFHTEVSYLDHKVVPYGTKGSVRFDVVWGPLERPLAVFDLKTGSAGLSAAREAIMRLHLPRGFENIPIIVIRPSS